MVHARYLLAAMLAFGCSTTQTPSTSRGGDPPAATTCDTTITRACFGELVTLAGAGQIGRKGEDGWRPEYEAGPAITAELSRPHFAMADDAGNIYIADKDANAVRRVAPDGTITTIPGDYQAPNGLWAGGDGTVYVLDLGHSRVVRVDASGSVSPVFEVADGISLGRGLWVNEAETLAYVASGSRVLMWTPGAGVTVFSTGFRSLGNLTVDPKGDLVVTDRGAGRVYRIDKDGNKHAIAGNGGEHDGGDGSLALQTSLPGVRAIWFTADGGYFLGTHESSRVWYVDAGGIMHVLLDHSDLSEVRGLSLQANGDLIIVDDDRGFIHLLPAAQPIEAIPRR